MGNVKSDAATLRGDLDAVIAAAAPEDLPALIGALEGAKARAWGRMLANGTGAGRADGAREPDENLSVREAARRLGVSKDWLYKNAGRLPFAVRIGRRLLFSSRALERWVSQRQCR